MQFLKRLILIIIVLALSLGAVVGAVGWQLSGQFDGQRLERMRASANYGGERFVNQEPEAAFEFTWASLKAQVFGTELREPPSPPPVVMLSAASLQRKAAPGLRVAWLGHANTRIEIDGLGYCFVSPGLFGQLL